MHASLMIAALLAAQPAPTTTTPVEALQIIRFNAAQADDVLMHRVVELTGEATEIYRDGMGGYIVRFDAAVRESHASARIEVHCHFAGTARGDLAKIGRGAAVTVRGIPRRTLDHLHFPVDPNVRLEVKDCVLIVASSQLPEPATE